MDRLIEHELIPVLERRDDPDQWSVATALAVVVSLADELEPGSPERRALARAALHLRPALRREPRRFPRKLGGGPAAAALSPGLLFLDQLLGRIT